MGWEGSRCAQGIVRLDKMKSDFLRSEEVDEGLHRVCEEERSDELRERVRANGILALNTILPNVTSLLLRQPAFLTL